MSWVAAIRYRIKEIFISANVAGFGAGFGLIVAGLAMVLIGAHGFASAPEYGALVFFGCLIGGCALGALFKRLCEDEQG